VEGRARRWEEADADALKKRRARCNQELTELSKIKKKTMDLSNMKSQIKGHETRLKFAKVDLEQQESRLATTHANLTVNQAAIAKKTPAAEKATAKAAKQEAKIDELTDQVNTLTDKVFGKFCKKIGVGDVREYEGTTMKVQQAEHNKMMEAQKHIEELQSHLDYERSRKPELDADRQQQIIDSAIAALGKQEAKQSEIQDEVSAAKRCCGFTLGSFGWFGRALWGWELGAGVQSPCVQACSVLIQRPTFDGKHGHFPILLPFCFVFSLALTPVLYSVCHSG
jgi:structural maintenance of chromosome 1